MSRPLTRLRALFATAFAPVLVSLAATTTILAQDDATQDPEPEFATYRLANGEMVRGAILQTEGDRIQMRVSIAGGAGRATSWYDFSAFAPSSQVRLKQARVEEGDVEGQLEVAEFAAEKGLFREATTELRRAFHMADGAAPGTHSHLKQRALDLVGAILEDMCKNGRVSEARAGLSRFLTRQGDNISESEQQRLIDIVETAADAHKAAAAEKRRAAQDVKQRAEIDRKIQRALKLLEEGQTARRRGLQNSRNFGSAIREFERATKRFEQAIAEAEKIKAAHSNDKELVSEIEAGIADAMAQRNDCILSAASMRLTRGQFNRAMEDVNRILADDAENREALAMRARIEVAANDWGRGRLGW